MSSDDASRVWRRVFRSMGEWEADVGSGSAWPAFVQAWAAAVRDALVREPPTVLDRRACWQAWLEAGPPHKKLAPARTLADYIGPAREPGEEG